jgi:class 3 adenylate cyclase
VPTWMSQVEHLWEEPSAARFFERLASFSRLIMYDRRGAGLSDPIVEPVTLEEQVDDLLAVMDAVGSERAALTATLEGGAMACMFAGTHPERTTALALYAMFPRTTRAEGGYEWAQTEEERAPRSDAILENWGDGSVAHVLAPSRAQDDRFVEWFGKLQRLASSPRSARIINDAIGRMDVRAILPTIRVPTLVMHRKDDAFLDIRHSRYVAEHIPGARFVELPPGDNLFAGGNDEEILGEVEEFLTGARHQPEPDRILATVLFTDIVGSTERAAALGDSEWRTLLGRHDQLVRAQLAVHRGREIKATGDGFLATFDGPARAIRCALDIGEAVGEADIQVRAGLHTGECEVIGDDVGGLAVHIGARVMGAANAGEVLCSSTVKDLVVGSGLEFEDRGERELKGVPGAWRLFAVA